MLVCAPCRSTPLPPVGVQAHSAAGHQLLRKLLSICTGKCELSSPRQPATPPQEGEEGAAHPHPHPQPAQRVLRPRHRPGQPTAREQQRGQPQRGQQQPKPQQWEEAAKPVQGQSQGQGQGQCSRGPQQPQAAVQHGRLQKPQQERQLSGPQQHHHHHHYSQRLRRQQQAEEESALCADLLDIVRRESGVVLALALHATHIWSQGSPQRTEACVRQGLVPLLLQVRPANPVSLQRLLFAWQAAGCCYCLCI